VKGPDLTSIELTQNPVSGSGPKAGKNVKKLDSVCAAVDCKSKLDLRNFEWKEIQVQTREDKIIVARILAMMRNLQWCSNHREVALQDLRELVRVMLTPEVREGMTWLERKRSEIDLPEEGKKMRDLLDRIVDSRRKTVHESVKHLRGLFTGLMKSRRDEEEDGGPATKKRKKDEGIMVSASDPFPKDPVVLVTIPMPATVQHTGIPLRLLKAPMTADKIKSWPWTNTSSWKWAMTEEEHKMMTVGVPANRCETHPKDGDHVCWSPIAMREASGFENPRKKSLREEWRRILWGIYDRVKEYESELWRLYRSLSKEEITAE